MCKPSEIRIDTVGLFQEVWLFLHQNLVHTDESLQQHPRNNRKHAIG